MPRRCCLALLIPVLLSASQSNQDQALWNEFGLVHSEVKQSAKYKVQTYEMKDLTGALAAWESLRSPNSQTCDLAPFCTRDRDRTAIADDNYVVVFQGGTPVKADLDTLFATLPNKRDTALPALLTFLPKHGRVPNSARYVLGPISLAAFAPELAHLKLGFSQGAEAQVAEYKVNNDPNPVHLALFYYPAPEMARLEMAQFQSLPSIHVKRSSVLLAVVFGPATAQQTDALLSLVEYEAKVTWNDSPPPPPMKPLYRLLLNIVYLSLVLTGVCLLAGLIYAGMRIYRRRYGSLESQEAMTTLRLTE